MFRRFIPRIGELSYLKRLFASDNIRIPKLNFEEVQAEIQRPNTFLLDVREKGELISDGKIPLSHNIPLGEVEAAMKLDEESFRQKYGFAKPNADNVEIVIHCKAGIRAMKAAATITQAGYSNVKVYDGILDWVSNGGSLIK